MTVMASLDNDLVGRVEQLQLDLADALTYATKNAQRANGVLANLARFASTLDEDGRLVADVTLEAESAAKVGTQLMASIQTVKDLVAALDGVPAPPA